MMGGRLSDDGITQNSNYPGAAAACAGFLVKDQPLLSNGVKDKQKFLANVKTLFARGFNPDELRYLLLLTVGSNDAGPTAANPSDSYQVSGLTVQQLYDTVLKSLKEISDNPKTTTPYSRVNIFEGLPPSLNTSETKEKYSKILASSFVSCGSCHFIIPDIKIMHPLYFKSLFMGFPSTGSKFNLFNDYMSSVVDLGCNPYTHDKSMDPTRPLNYPQHFPRMVHEDFTTEDFKAFKEHWDTLVNVCKNKGNDPMLIAKTQATQQEAKAISTEKEIAAGTQLGIDCIQASSNRFDTVFDGLSRNDRCRQCCSDPNKYRIVSNMAGVSSSTSQLTCIKACNQAYP